MSPDLVPPRDTAAVEAAYARLDALTLGEIKTLAPLGLVRRLWPGWRLVSRNRETGPSVVVLATDDRGRWATIRFNVRSASAFTGAMTRARAIELHGSPLDKTWAEVPWRQRLDIIEENRQTEENHHVCADLAALLTRLGPLVSDFDLDDEFALILAELRRRPAAEQEATRALIGLTGASLDALIEDYQPDRYEVTFLD